MAGNPNILVHHCKQKVRHATKSAAKYVASKLKRSHPELEVQYYRCKQCGGYHVGTDRHAS